MILNLAEKSQLIIDENIKRTIIYRMRQCGKTEMQTEYLKQLLKNEITRQIKRD